MTDTHAAVSCISSSGSSSSSSSSANGNTAIEQQRWSATATTAAPAKNTELVSVIIPAYNCAPFLGECLESVLAQTHRPLEVSIYVDRSTDDTLKVCRSWVARLQSSPGVSGVRLSCYQCCERAARNASLSEAAEEEAVQSAEDTAMPLASRGTYICACGSIHQDGAQHRDSSAIIPFTDTPIGTTTIAANTTTSTSVELGRASSSSSSSSPSSSSLSPPEVASASTAVVAASVAASVAPAGAGRARDRAIRQSTGGFLCILDSDDVMAPRRIELQLGLAKQYPHALIGSNFHRVPAGSTQRYTRWANSLTQSQLVTHRFRDCTLIQPTWFLRRAHYDRQGGYDPRPAEDLVFQLRHWDFHARSGASGPVYVKCNEDLLMYRFRPGQLTFTVPRTRLREVRVAALERQILRVREPWCGPVGFGVWGAGKDGRAFYRQLSKDVRARVSCFYDVDSKKIGTTYNELGEDPTRPGKRRILRRVPIRSVDEITPPFVTCVAMDRETSVQGKATFEQLLSQKKLTEGIDYILFC